MFEAMLLLCLRFRDDKQPQEFGHGMSMFASSFDGGLLGFQRYGDKDIFLCFTKKKDSLFLDFLKMF